MTSKREADARLTYPSTSRLIQEAWSEVTADPTEAVRLRQCWGLLFERLFPTARPNA